MFQSLYRQIEVEPRYWSVDNPKYEIGFLIQIENAIYPIEVKSDKNIESKSLRMFKKMNPTQTILRVRYSLCNLCLDDVLNIPLVFSRSYKGIDRNSDTKHAILAFMDCFFYFPFQVITKGAFLDRYEEGNKKLYGILFLIVLIFQAISFASHMVANGYSLFAASPTLEDLPITTSFFMFAVLAFSYYLRLWKDKREEGVED